MLLGRWRRTFLQSCGLLRMLQRSLSSVQTSQRAVLTATPLDYSIQSASPCTLTAGRCLHSSPRRLGLEEFFPKDDPIEEGERTGRQWEARELRQKSNEDLHKLWYVLLKERNMLMTVRHEARRMGFIMPAPERMWKVRKSMARIKLVLGERERAITKAKEIMKSGDKEKAENQQQTEPHPSPTNSVDSQTVAQ